MAGITPKKPSNKSGEEIKKIIKDKISALEEENIRLEDELSEQTKLQEEYKLDFEKQKIQYEHEIRKISEHNRKLKNEIEDKKKQLVQINEQDRDYFTLENQKFALKERIRQLEAERKEYQGQVSRYEREIRKLRGEIENMKKPPLVIGTLMDVIDERRAVVRSSAGPRFMVSVSHGIDSAMLRPGAVCTLNQQSLAIVDVIRASYDEQLKGMELIESPMASYEDIGGLEKEITEIKEAVELPLTDPEVFRKIGIDPPKGVLLYGPPGTGKTLLARAVASQTHASFIRVVGSELVQKYIGEGARLVRELFEMAKEKSPSIIFIDEIDAIGSFRTDGETSGDREVQRTLMQLLAEMDGFDNRGDVRIIGATNRIDMLDEALLRPGRFDRVIRIPPPDAEGRLSILKIHTRGMNIDKAVELMEVARRSEGLNGADLRAVCMEAGMYAIRSGHDTVMPDDFEKAILKLSSGDEYHYNNRYGVGEMFA